MKITIFYSWQSDLPSNTNRAFIEKAIGRAIKEIKAEEDTVLEPCIDRDTDGVPGSPDIASTIFRKIEECQVFIGDVSIINPGTETTRKMPNPNVMLELGYAAGKLTWDNIICVCNTAFGKVEELPFDLRMRRMCPYLFTQEQANKAEERDQLVGKLKIALSPMLKRLAVKVQEDAAPKPLTPDAVGAKVKEYLADDRNRIQLRDLVIAQGNELAQKIVAPEFPVKSQPPPRADDIKQRVQKYEEISQPALAVMIAGCYYGTQSHEKEWIGLLQRVANPQADREGWRPLVNLRRYPALLLSYGGGIAAIENENYGTLLAILTEPKLADGLDNKDHPLLSRLTAYDVIEKETAIAVIGRNYHTPISEHFFQLLREPFRVLIHDDRKYERCFDLFEYLRSLLEFDITGDVQSVGRYALPLRRANRDVRNEIDTEEGRFGKDWPLYKAGWFGGKRERFMAAKNKVNQFVAGLAWR